MTTPLSSLSSSLGSRLLAGAGTLALLGGIGLMSSRPARTAGGPVPVTVANAPLAVTATEGQPVEGYIAVKEPNAAGSSTNTVYTVPPGKRLVVESMTLFCNFVGNTDGYSCLVFNVDGTPNVVSFATLTAEPGTSTFTATTQPMRLHVGPGGKVLVRVFKTGTGAIDAVVGLSGHLADAP